jgi:hypothetical protein
VIHSTTIALPAWHLLCAKFKLKVKLIPRDVVMRWNSTYDMLVFAVEYRQAIDALTADKQLKLRKYELSDDDWRILDKLVSVLQVCKLWTSI